MRKKIFLLLAFIVLLFPNYAKADTNYAITSKCTIRTEPNEGGKWLVPGKVHYLDPNDMISLVEGVNPVDSTNEKCSTKYYNVIYSGEKGYVCGDFINFNNDGTYYEELRNAGFPESYLLSLNALKKNHPNWEFQAIKTGLNWDAVIKEESSVGKNYIHAKDPDGTDAVYLSLDGGSYDATTKKFIQLSPGGYYAANKYTVAYYIDPRNFLNDRDIFMFESNYYNSEHSDEQLSNAISNVFRNNTLNNYVSAFLSTKTLGINPIFVATRSRQEVAVNNDVTSAANGSKGYYNFFNIGAYDSCSDPIYCGNIYASSRGWTTAEAAITGGAYWIYNNYTIRNQQTIYFQKFNVNNSGNTYAHQYMTNIVAARSEADFLYKGYVEASALENKKTFYIPVYEDMPSDVSVLPTAIDQKDLDHANSGNENTTNTLSIAEIVNGSGLTYSNNYLTGLAVGTTGDSLISALQAMSNEAKIEIAGNGIEKDFLGTGDKITITNNGKTETLTIVIYGDANGDGKINPADLLAVKKKILKIIDFDSLATKAADINKNNEIDPGDLLSIKKSILKIESIKQ